MDISGRITSSAYITKDSENLYSGCGDGIIVRPYGEGVTYPIPANSTAAVEGVTIYVDARNVGKFAFTTKQTSLVETLASGYWRWIGTFSGGLVGGLNSTGIALWEQMGPFVEA